MQKGNPAFSSILGPDPAPAARGLRLNHMLLAWWFVCLVVSPLYVLKSGLPQPGDIGMAVLILLLLTGYFARIPIYQTLYLVAGVFLANVALVNWFWYTQFQEPKFLLSSVFYFYDFLVVVVILSLAKEFGADFWRITRAALIAMIAAELAVVLFLPEFRGLRATGTFNNPNQLGYWSLLSAACYLSLKDRSGKASSRLTFFDVGVLCLLGYITTQSLSKAAMLSFMIMFLAAIYCQGARPRVKLALAGILLIGAGLVATKGLEDIQSWLSEGSTGLVIDRLEDVGKGQSDSFAARGYDRIWENPEYLILGAGEGGPDRFDSYANEIHSTFATVLFSYGFLGLAFFLLLLWIIFQHAERRLLIYFVPIVLYGMTHQGLRFTLLWVFLGLVFARTRYDRTAVAKLPAWTGDVATARAGDRKPPAAD